MSEPTPEEVARACEALRAVLNKPMTGREARVISAFDQIRAECRDDPMKREAVVRELMERGATREEAEAWIDDK